VTGECDSEEVIIADEVDMKYLDRFERNPKICGGQWVVRGTRVPVRVLLASLAEGATTEELLEDFPTITKEDVQAVIAFAAASVEEDLPVAELPVIS
jgi:uncharacterized protein (DUF433 family)